jgi:1-acyl-sn-glycerol-3-phosphate acyltransferase
MLALVRLYYPWVSISGTVPTGGPVILVANHPNGLLDPAVLAAALRRPVSFLAKSTLFGNPAGAFLMNTFRAIPVYRAKEADTAQNEHTFARCREILAEGGWIALFPEGVSHDASGLLPLKTGAARIALGAGVPLRVVPVGILYEDKDIFRSRVALAFGDPVVVEAGEETSEAVRELTERIAGELGEVVLQARDREIWRGLLLVAAWEGGGLGRVEARARELADVWRRLALRDPARLEALADAVRAYVRRLETLGVRDPLAIEAAPPSVVPSFLPLLVAAPLALVGALLGWAPYRLVRVVANRLAGPNQDLVSTFKIFGGLFFIGGTWIVEAVAAAWWLGPLASLAVFLVAPATGLIALRWDESLTRRREAFLAGRVARKQRLAEALAERRRELLAAVADAERDAG